jgi:integral membrane protein
MLRTPVHTLRMLALTEGISFLILIFIAMPLKYLADLPMAVKWTGWIHGVLFVFFAFALAYVFFKERWPFWRGVLVFVAALIPFGPFLIDKKFKHWGG